MKLAMLTALAFRPRLLVLDEPFAGLDAAMRGDLVSGLLELSQDAVPAVLLASHDLAEVERLADRVGFLREGRLLYDEPLGQLLDRHRRVEVEAEEPIRLPSPTPATWLHPRVEGRRLQLLHSAYEEGKVRRELDKLIPGAVQTEVSEADLEEILVAVQKTPPGGLQAQKGGRP